MAPDEMVTLRWLGWANTWTWEEHMEAACRDMSPAEAGAAWKRYGGEEGARRYRELHSGN